MAKARIFQVKKNPMQSGVALTGQWKLEFAPEKPVFVDNLMGWNGMTDMPQEINLFFNNREEAVAYAQAHHIAYELGKPVQKRLVRKAYADNFKFDKVTG